MQVSNSYSDHQFEPTKYRATVRRMVDNVRRLREIHNIDTVVVSGKSGIAMAFALQLFMDIAVVVVRKSGENSHGDKVEGRNGHEVKRFVILDDFVSTGATINRILADIEDRCDMRQGEMPRCVGVLVYEKDAGRDEVDTKFGRLHVFRDRSDVHSVEKYSLQPVQSQRVSMQVPRFEIDMRGSCAIKAEQVQP